MCFFCAGPTFGVPLAHQMYIGYEEFVIPPILHNTTTYLLSYLHVEGKLISVFVGGFFFFFFPISLIKFSRFVPRFWVAR
jgi:hypothetical protein